MSSARVPDKLPKNAVGLDSWANVYLRHDMTKNAEFPHSLNLAHGKCQCRRSTAEKGVPECHVPAVANGSNIDLFPEGFLWERGCVLKREDKHTVTTPKGRVFEIDNWGGLPFVTRDVLNKIIQDLPAADVPGRTGECPREPTVMRAARLNHRSELKEHLSHLNGVFEPKKMKNMVEKYVNLPDLYHDGDSNKFVAPNNFEKK